MCELAGCRLEDLLALRPRWDDLPPDNYLKDGGHYRRRRHSCFVVQGDEVTQAPHRAHWQPVEYNALHGGMQRWFEPMAAGSRRGARLGAACCGASGRSAPPSRAARPGTWKRTSSASTPKAASAGPRPRARTGMAWTSSPCSWCAAAGIKGGETRVFDAEGPAGQRFTLTEPWSLLLLDDERVIHESTPIQPVAAGGHRDTLVLTYRAGGFQGG